MAKSKNQTAAASKPSRVLGMLEDASKAVDRNPIHAAIGGAVAASSLKRNPIQAVPEGTLKAAPRSHGRYVKPEEEVAKVAMPQAEIPALMHRIENEHVFLFQNLEDLFAHLIPVRTGKLGIQEYQNQCDGPEDREQEERTPMGRDLYKRLEELQTLNCNIQRIRREVLLGE